MPDSGKVLGLLRTLREMVTTTPSEQSKQSYTLGG